MKFIKCVLISFIICAALLLTENAFCKKMINIKKKENNHQIDQVIYRLMRDNSTITLPKHLKKNSKLYSTMLSRIGKKRSPS
jgi:hypothetical protein